MKNELKDLGKLALGIFCIAFAGMIGGILGFMTASWASSCIKMAIDFIKKL